jgi:hypothetical protein
LGRTPERSPDRFPPVKRVALVAQTAEVEGRGTGEEAREEGRDPARAASAPATGGDEERTCSERMGLQYNNSTRTLEGLGPGVAFAVGGANK